MGWSTSTAHRSRPIRSCRTPITLELLLHPLPAPSSAASSASPPLGVDHRLIDATRRHGPRAPGVDAGRHRAQQLVHHPDGEGHPPRSAVASSPGRRAQYLGAPEDKAIARKWESLADHAPGTLGRSVADFYDAHHFPFPGERHGISELGAQHDFVHVLADYDATPEGEIDVFAFIAASMADPEGLHPVRVHARACSRTARSATSPARRSRSPAPTPSSDPGAVDRWADALHRGAVVHRRRHGRHRPLRPRRPPPRRAPRRVPHPPQGGPRPRVPGLATTARSPAAIARRVERSGTAPPTGLGWAKPARSELASEGRESRGRSGGTARGRRSCSPPVSRQLQCAGAPWRFIPTLGRRRPPQRACERGHRESVQPCGAPGGRGSSDSATGAEGM